MNASKERYRMLDLLRGVTVFFMIAAHAVYFFHNDTNVFLTYIEKFGNTIAFTTFLIVSAATAEIAYYSKEDTWQKEKKRLKKRISVLTIGYFTLASVVFFADLVSSHGLNQIKLVANILTLRQLAPFAEFYIPFIVFPLIIVLGYRFFRKITKSVYITLFFGLAIYFLGMFYYRLPIYELFVPWKALLFGHSGYYRFPIFQYFPVYLLGIVWGRHLLLNRNRRHQKEIAKAISIVSALGIGFSALAMYTSNGKLDELLRRWPPSIFFLLLGIFFASTVAFILYKTNQLKKLILFRDGLLVLGQNALGLALTHVFLLQIYTIAGGLKTSSISMYMISFFILMILSLVLAAIIPFNFRFSLNLEKGKCNEHELEEEPIIRFEEEISDDIKNEVNKLEKYFFIGPYKNEASHNLIKRRHVLGISLLLGLTTLTVLPPVAEEVKTQKMNKTEVTWEDTDYSWRKKLTIANDENIVEIQSGELVKTQINYSSLSSSKKAYPDGRDFSIKYWDGKKFQSVNFWFTQDIGQPSGTIYIKLKDRLKPGDETGNYYLYYGNNLAKSIAEQGTRPGTTKAKHTIRLAQEENYPLMLTLDRRWSILTDNPKVSDTLRIALQSSTNYSATKVEYEIIGTNLKGELEKTSEKHWEGIINVSNLKPGEYQIKAKVKENTETFTSSLAGFFVSYPLYIAWTQDWEGYDVPDTYLGAITQIADEHGLVMTHFWNPRLTMTDTIAQNRKEALLSWVKNREASFGESIQLHLHMFTDFVTASGVAPIYTPNWGDSGDGYGSLATNYNTEDMTKIISKGIEVMKQSGLAVPNIFRAGGWFANSNTLKAVENSGLLADSSGRTAYKFFNQSGPWNLSQVAQPYYPSVSDQNTSGIINLSILEIPNNGADSYWFSSEEMENRFTANYPGGILSEPRQITYLSHPHWFNKAEQTKIEKVFNLVDQYKYNNDSGPAIYVTLDEIYEVWSGR